MSLTVPPELLKQAQDGKIDNTAFLACIRDSLPFAWSLIEELVHKRERSGAEFVDNQVAPPSQEGYGQLFRALASNAIREALEAHFGVRLAFQNCHRVAVFAPSAEKAYAEFTTPVAQILNQTPELVNC
ncbi:SCO5389 family protein [Nonomuraea roseoviolacea subsp. roseoviolacea]|uniref:SCO5389 family protein n=1 Tax=Nonomuraea roseoviolacea TaxID=103837 RepID=UPI0031E29676